MYICGKFHSNSVYTKVQRVEIFPKGNKSSTIELKQIPKPKYLLKPNIRGTTRESRIGRRYYSAPVALENFPKKIWVKITESFLVALGSPRIWPVVLIITLLLVKMIHDKSNRKYYYKEI